MQRSPPRPPATSSDTSPVLLLAWTKARAALVTYSPSRSSPSDRSALHSPSRHRVRGRRRAVIEGAAPVSRPPLSRAPALHHGHTTPSELFLGRPASIGPCVAPTTTTRGLQPKYQCGSTSSPRSRRRFTPGRRVDGTTHQLRPRNRRDFSPLGATSPLTPARHDGTVGGRRHTFL